MSTAMPGSPDGRQAAGAKSRPRTPAELEAEIRRTRERLASNVDQIADRVKPANVARRGTESVKARLTDGSGRLSTQRVAAVAAVAAVLVGLVLRRRSR